MNKRSTIWILIILALTIYATYNFSRPLIGINIWETQPTIAQAYGSGFLMSIPMWIGLLTILLIIHKENSIKSQENKK